MLSTHVVVFVLLGGFVATIASYYLVAQWLNDFAYRASINPMPFSLAVAAVLVVAFLTVALQSFRTINANPVLSLRCD